MTTYVHGNRDYFYGQTISEYGKEHGYVDYAALANSFNHVLANNIMNAANDWEVVCGSDFTVEEDDDAIIMTEFYQYFIVDWNGKQILEDAEECVYYSESLDLFVWAVDHWGTSWDYVLTNIRIEDNREA